MIIQKFGNIHSAVILQFFLFFHHGALSSFLTTVRPESKAHSGRAGIVSDKAKFEKGKKSEMTNSLIERSQNSDDNLPKFVLPEDYDREQLPPALVSSEPIIVWFDLHVDTINPIKTSDMDLRIDMTLTQRWVDSRLNFTDQWLYEERDFFVLPLDFISKIWHPFPYIVNAKSSDIGRLTQKLIAVYIFRNQTVHFISTMYTIFECAMNYRYFPYDHQLCPMYIESFSYDETQVKYEWNDGDPFTISSQLRLLQFQLTRPLHYHETSVPRYLEARNFSQLIACFRFDRLLGNHLIQTFAPCSLIVCLSWFSFWLELNALSARMSLVVTSILTLVTQFVGLKADIPPVAYIKAVDIWMAGCLVCVFGSLGEYVLVKVLYSETENAKYDYYEKTKFHDGSSTTGNLTNGEAAVLTEQDFHTFSYRRDMPSRPRRIAGSPITDKYINHLHRQSFSFDEIVLLEKVVFGKFRIPLQWIDPVNGGVVFLWKKIDNYSKWVFPLVYFIFCAMYWLLLYLHYTSTKVQPYSRQFDLYKPACVE